MSVESNGTKNAGTGVVACPACGSNLTTEVVSIESFDDELWELSGLYCPTCLERAIVERCKEFAELDKKYSRFVRSTRMPSAKVLPASA